jgi:hypothetical protein
MTNERKGLPRAKCAAPRQGYGWRKYSATMERSNFSSIYLYSEGKVSWQTYFQILLKLYFSTSQTKASLPAYCQYPA